MSESTVREIDLLPKEKETNKHANAILNLAEELGAPVEEVRRTYEQTLDLFQNATVKDYIPIFVSRCVRERLKQLHHQY